MIKAKRKLTSRPKQFGRTDPRLQIIIETPRGSRNKLKFDSASRQFKLSKVMPEGMMFPYDFGYVPSTKAEDGDPLDVLVLTDAPLFPGCQVDCRLIGVIKAEQEQEGKTTRNDRLIAVAEASLLYSETRSLNDLNPTVLKQIDDFFVNYQRVRNVHVTILDHGGPSDAQDILQKASRRKHAA
jgi:inorganic pyrophosphatase